MIIKCAGCGVITGCKDENGNRTCTDKCATCPVTRAGHAITSTFCPTCIEKIRGRRKCENG